jgi:hypothetical protein
MRIWDSWPKPMDKSLDPSATVVKAAGHRAPGGTGPTWRPTWPVLYTSTRDQLISISAKQPMKP